MDPAEYPMWEFGHMIVEVGFIEKLKRLTSLINVVSWKGTLIKISSYNVPFVCNFVLENYPFDNQKCQVIIANFFFWCVSFLQMSSPWLATSVPVPSLPSTVC